MLEERILYSISDVVEATGVNASKLRHWESVTTILSPQRPRGQRRYTPEQVEIVHKLRGLVEEQGMSLVAAERQIQDGGSKTNVSVIQWKLEAILKSLDVLILRMQRD